MNFTYYISCNSHEIVAKTSHKLYQKITFDLFYSNMQEIVDIHFVIITRDTI